MNTPTNSKRLSFPAPGKRKEAGAATTIASLRRPAAGAEWKRLILRLREERAAWIGE